MSPPPIVKRPAPDIANEEAPLKIPRVTAPVPDEHHALLTVADIRKPFMNKLRDVSVHVGNERIPCHKLILAAASPVLERRFATENVKTVQPLVIRCSKPCWNAVQQFIYEGDTQITSVDFALQLMKTAKEYEIAYLVRKIVDYLIRNMDDSNVYDILRISFHYKLESLVMLAKERIMAAGPLTRICQMHIFWASYHMHLVEQLLASDDSLVQSELDVFVVAKVWLTHNGNDVMDSRKPAIEKLISYVDLQKLNNHELGLLHRSALDLKLYDFALKIQDMHLSGECAQLPAIAPTYRLLNPRRNKTLSFTYKISGVCALNDLYGDDMKLESNWYRDDFGHFWRLMVSKETVENHKFLGVFLACRVPKKPDDFKIPVRFQCFVVKREKYEAVNVRERATEFDKTEEKSRQGWREFLAFDKLGGDDGITDPASDSVTLGATIYFDQ